ncbi:MAG: alpha/beta family hydrolase [Jatrophihabitantaceae bacterium]
MVQLNIPTPVGPAQVELDQVRGAGTLLVIGHGAGGSVESADLLAIRDACRAAGISVARVTQPYRLAGRKAPPAAGVLDQAWSAVITALGRRKALAGLSFVYAGRSSGARVACRTAADDLLTPRPVAVVAIAFPVHPPGKPEKSRLDELAAVPVPVLVVQGVSDPFGMPEPAPGRTVRQLPGDHSLKRSAGEVGAVVAGWLGELG